MLNKLIHAVAATLLLTTTALHAEVITKVIPYQVDGTDFTGYLAYDDAIEKKRPGILVVHEWWGHNDYARKRAEMLAEEGYTAFALDMYGDGKLANHPDNAKAFMMEVVNNMDAAEKRFMAAKDILAKHDSVNSENISAIGYCFGGGMVINMARRGVDLDAVVSFHGSIGTQTPAKAGDIQSKLLVFNGGADPFVTSEQVVAFIKEMENASVDYRFVSYAGVKHSFTNPGADNFAEKFEMPLAYDADADHDSWQQTLAFFNSLYNQE